MPYPLGHGAYVEVLTKAFAKPLEVKSDDDNGAAPRKTLAPTRLGRLEEDASAGNRARVKSMATMYSATRPLMLELHSLG